ncbi:MAG: amidohydrolase family protein [Cyclobacteriaceae bacterium]|nr:amidohydrolase family protein [Cyclobacteriaceae bacterium]
MKKIIYLILFVCAGVAAKAQSPKGKYGTFALTNATIETVTKGTINNGTVIISNGKITYVGAATTAPAGAEVIDCKGKWIYPGFIDSGTNLGLSEVGSDQRTIDMNEIGEVIPQMQALTAVNPNSVLIPVTRVNGVTTVLTAPVGSMFPGTAALINLHGYTPDQMYANFKGVVVNFPSTGRRGGFDRRSDEDIKSASEKAMKKLNEVFDRAIQFHKLDSATKGKGVEYYPEMEAMLPVVRGERTILLEVNAAKDILEALTWVKERKLKNVVLTGCREGWRVAGDIAKAGLPVIAGPVLALPSREYDRYDKAYANPGLMKKAGVKVALRTSETENVRNLLFNAGFAAAYGLGREEALKAVTIVPAEIFGVSDKLGSIEVGKTANIVVSDGDPFETKTNIIHVFIDGWQIPMVSRHTQLYDEFLKREPGVNKSQK